MSECIHGEKFESCVDCYKWLLERSKDRNKSIISGMGNKIESLQAENKLLTDRVEELVSAFIEIDYDCGCYDGHCGVCRIIDGVGI